MKLRKRYVSILMAFVLPLVMVVPALADGEVLPESTPTEAVAPTEEVTEVPTTEASTDDPAVTETPVAEETTTATDEGELGPSETPVPADVPTEEASLETASLLDNSSLDLVPRLRVKKDAFGQAELIWRWGIAKSADESSLTLSPGQSHQVNYTITANATGPVGQWSVWGAIRIANTSTVAATVLTIEDVLSDGTVPSVSCPFVLPVVVAGGTKMPDCTYSASGSGSPPASNTVNVYMDDGAGGSILGDSLTVPVVYSATNSVDECVDVSDSLMGLLGTVCAGTETSFTFTYSLTIGPFDVCGDYDVPNVASFLSNDTGTTGSAAWNVDVSVPCAGGCSLTPGYWKTHSMYGPAPYDATWASLGEDTIFFRSGKTYYQVLWTSPSGG
ncbi:MAG: hypothetical protein HW404_1773, partial [Anaerolineales bacterium]|nr:hypothetical protein [Anaerolineales bacterium]